jgi:hypothetical protein
MAEKQKNASFVQKKAPRKDCKAVEKFPFYLPGIFETNTYKRIIRVITS